RGNGEQCGDDDRGARRGIGPQLTIVVESHEAARRGLEQAVIEEVEINSLRQWPDRDGEHIGNRGNAEQEQEELATPGEAQPASEHGSGNGQCLTVLLRKVWLPGPARRPAPFWDRYCQSGPRSPPYQGY